MPTTRRQQELQEEPLGWIDLDLWHTNAPPEVDDHPVVEPPIDGQPLQLDQAAIPPLSPLSPLSSLPPSPQLVMSPTRSGSRGQRAHSRACSDNARPLSTSRTLPEMRCQPESANVGTSTRTRPLEQRIMDAPISLRRLAEHEDLRGIENNANQK